MRQRRADLSGGIGGVDEDGEGKGGIGKDFDGGGW
jgi:hypothetical protein